MAWSGRTRKRPAAIPHNPAVRAVAAYRCPDCPSENSQPVPDPIRWLG